MTESTSSSCSGIDLEITRLKRALGAGDLEGHTCGQCEDLRIPPLPSTASELATTPFFELDTTVKRIREELAASGCQFWSTIQDLLTFVSLQGRFPRQHHHYEYAELSKPGGIKRKTSGGAT